MGTLKNIQWPEIASKMQENNYSFTKEACCQHFQKIRREYKGYNYGDDSPSRPSTSKVPKVSKSTTSKSTPQKRGMAQKGLFEPTTYQDDDEEDMGHLAKRKRSLKPEAPEEQSAPIFKMEGSGGSGPNGRAVDLVNDDLYEEDYYDHI